MIRPGAGPAPRARRAAPTAIAAFAGALAGGMAAGMTGGVAGGVAGGIAAGLTWGLAVPAAAQQPAAGRSAEPGESGAVGPPLQLVPRPALPPTAPPEPPTGGDLPADVRAVPLLPAEPTLDEDPAAEAPAPGGPAGMPDASPAEAERLWAGLEPAAVARLIGQVPVGAESPAMRTLAGRLLAAPMPPEARRPAVLAERAARLAELGLAAALESLAGRHGGFVEAPAAARELARARLTAGDAGRACAVVDRFAPDPTARSAAAPVDWRPMALLCALEAGRRDVAASLVRVLADAAAEDGRAPRSVTLAALGEAALTGGPVDLPADAWRVLGRADPVLVALLARTERPQPNAVLGARAPAVLAAVARAPANAPELRARAAERAAAAGVLDPAALAALWADLPFEGEAAAVLRRSAAEQGAEIRARLMHAAAALAARGETAEAQRYRRRALYLAQAEAAPLPVVLAIVETLDADTAAVDPIAAAEAARALYAAGRPARAEDWRNAALAAGGAEAGRAIDRLWPLERLSRRAHGPADTAALAAWFEAETAQAGEVGTHAAATVLTVLQALGDPVDPSLWHRLPIDDSRDTTLMPSAALAGRLAVEARPDRPAATALLSLLALGDQGTADSHPMLLGAVVRALTVAGLDDAARQFSREAVWAAQL